MTKAQVVVIGAGVVGASVAWHLAEKGWKDVIVVDKGPIPVNDGSTSHAPGGVVAISHSKVMTQMAQYATELYRRLEPVADFPRRSYNAVGGLDVALSEEKWTDLVRLEGKAKAWHINAQLLGPKETKEKMPLINEKLIKGSIFVESSALVSGVHLVKALLRDAAQKGVQVFANTGVTDIEVNNGHVSAVLTSNPAMPRIECEQIVLATNVWGPILGEKLDIPIPLIACEHQYVFLDPIKELERFDTNKLEDEVFYPTVRVQDITTYFRQHWNTIGIGNYWHRPLLVEAKKLAKTAMHPFTPEDFKQSWERSQELFPLLQGHNRTRAFNGIFAFPIDGYPILGEAATVKGFWSATGSWLTHAGGVGKCIAEWMTDGATEWDMRQVHIQRFHGYQNTPTYISAVSDKNYREIWFPGHPRQPMTEPRNVRLSPFADRHNALKSVYTTFAGLELPNWAEENSRLLEKYDDQIPERTGFAAEFWSRIQGAEHLETRNNVGLFDLTGLSIIEVKGSAATKFVNYLCSSQMNKPVGNVMYTCWLTPKGGIRRDLAVARVAKDSYWMFVGEGTLPQDMAWVQSFAPDGIFEGGSVQINDISNQSTGLGLWGPNARKVLAKVTAADISNEAFPYMTWKWIDIGMAKVFAMRISYAGELGWELHIPFDQALHVWDKLWQAGREFDMISAGQGCFDSLRLEKGYRLWGGDIYTEYTPYEAGMAWTVRLNKKEDFVGKEACLKLKDKPLKKQLCCIVSDDPGAIAFGYEPIFKNGGPAIGHVTTGNFGYSIGKYIAYGYLPSEHAEPGTNVEIEFLGKRYKATVSNEPLWDPHMDRIKA